MLRRFATASFVAAFSRTAVTLFEGDLLAFKEAVSEKPTVVDFFATWCGPCKQAAPKFEAMSNTHNKIKFLKIDVDENEAIAEEYNLRSIPTFVTFKDGKQVDFVEGGNMEKVEEIVKKL